MDHYAHGLKLSAAGQHARAIEAFERALAAAPADTRILFALGNTARTLGMAPAAEHFYRQVLTLDPARLEATVNLANLLRQHGRFEAAEALIRPALARNPESAELLLTLGSIRREQGRGEEAVALYREALQHRPGCVPALVNLADLLCDRGEDREALALYQRALKSEPDNAQARLNRAMLHLLRGNLKDGWRDYAARLQIPGKVPLPDHNLPRWSGDTLKRTRLLITAEQGIGDHLMFASLIPELLARAAKDGGSLVLECEPRLKALFARSFAGAVTHDWQIETRAGVTRAHYGWLKSLGGANAAIEIGSLPKLLRKTLDSFAGPQAYLKPDADEAAHWRRAFDGLPRPWIGLCWRSGLTGGTRAVQYAPLDAWGRFLQDMGGTAIAAQYDATAAEIAQLESLSGRTVVVPQGIDQKKELDRTAGLLSVLDGVVSAPTAVSWLSAGLGIATFKALYDLTWTAFGTATEPFAPATRLLMPKRRGDWADVLAQALDNIRSLPV